ncbi:hypothetical protein C8Q74DRAFT_1318894 [Fomes fomentarius]|nr:hypothetical protein C8Q74DRAFT_1318894 [Fomes fomentarius]
MSSPVPVNEGPQSPHSEELQPPSSDDVQPRGTVVLLHPGYDRILFSLPAFDSLGGRFGVNRSVAQDACRIITNNEEGFLATDREGNLALPNADPNIERGRIITILLYPVVTEFASWVFPKTMPAHWTRNMTIEQFAACLVWTTSEASAMSNAVTAQDQRCIVTHFFSEPKNARLVPRDQLDWFLGNNMDQFSLSRNLSINDVANGVTLRSDVRACMDRHNFVFYPTEGGRYVAYAQLLHRRLVFMHPRVATQFLYARFAYNIKHLLYPNLATLGRSFPIPKSVLDMRQCLEKAKEEYERNCHSCNSSTTDDADSDAEQSATQSGAPQDNLSAQSDKLEFIPDERHWKETFVQRFPLIHKLPEVEHPPDVLSMGFGCHVDTPRILRLSEEYILKCGKSSVQPRPSETWKAGT